jgi:ABC-2 type transport system permease protein
LTAAVDVAVRPVTVGLAAQLGTVRALLERDLRVLLGDLNQFVLRAVMQPALFAFVFAYVFPRIGQGIGGTTNSGRFAGVLLPGLIATTLLFQGVFTVALPLVQEFSFSREIEDRVMAPIPLELIALAKILSGALQGLVSAVLVVPAVWAASGFDVDLTWSHPLLLISIVPLGALLGASLGLFLGTVVEPRKINLIFTLLILPLTLLGCVYYPWATLEHIRWLQVGVLLNPVVYMSEGLRAALTPGADHLPLWAVYALIVGATGVMARVGVSGFIRRVLT